MSTIERQIIKIVDELEDPLNAYLLRCNNYKDIYNLLEMSATKVEIELVERLFRICIRDMKEDMRYSANALSLIPLLIDKIKLLPSLAHTPSLLSSALQVLNILKLGANVQIDALLTLSIQCLNAYPEFVIISLVEHHSQDIYEILESRITLKSNNKSSTIKFMELLPYKLLNIILKKLPQKQKTIFVENGFKVWFKSVIPKLFEIILVPDVDIEECIDAVEELTQSLIPLDYTEDPSWKNLMEKYICKVDQFPAIIKSLLQEDKKFWHRLWIILIKLLKNQLTAVASHLPKSPINSLLPVVEQAFKMKQEIRYQAFLCWDALVDSFSSDITDSLFDKRMKLLIIPLKTNNAKIELTIQAKFNSWWNLIRRFYNKMDVLLDSVLFPFFQFCFGKFVNDKILPSPGQFNNLTQRLCVQALVEIAGHLQCEGCCQIPKLPGRFLSIKLLIAYWNNWLFYFKSAVLFLANDNSETVTQQVKCLWKSMLSTIAELPENNVRRDMVKDLLDVLISLLKLDGQIRASISDKVFILIMTMFDDQENFYSLLITKDNVDDGPLHKILSILVHQPFLSDYFQSKERKEILIKFKPLACFILNTKYSLPDEVLDKLCRKLYPRVPSMLLWMAIADAISESNLKIYQSSLKDSTISSFLLWPLTYLYLLPNDITSEAWSPWVTLYNAAAPKLKNELNVAIMGSIENNNKLREFTSYFEVSAALTVLKNLLFESHLFSADINKGINLIIKIMKKCKPQEVTQVFPLMTDTVILLLNLDSSSNMTEPGLKMMAVVLELFIPTLICQNKKQLMRFLEHILKDFDKLLTPQTPIAYLPQIINQLLECMTSLDKNSSLYETIKTICSKCLLNNYQFDDKLLTKLKDVVPSICTEENKVICVETDPIFETNKTMSDTTCSTPNTTSLKESDPGKQIKEQEVPVNNFTTPNTKGLSRKSHKKEPNIVNTVVENGEEFVVVKSNWKFNPRKLTENQKEKFKRKREDIPALYQDLSQSQDEFQLKRWKTDSQDTTSSTSNSKSDIKSTNEDVTSILKDIPGTHVVPSIIENIAVDKSKRDFASIISELNTPTLPSSSGQTNKKKIKDSLATPNSSEKPKTQISNETKSPRMALKDRVFRNVRNLIEKSTIQNDSHVKPQVRDQNLNENLPKTPEAMITTSKNHTNSAPPKITTERPCRVIKKPKKFEDSELLVLKKRRRLINDSQTDRELPEISLTSNTGKDMDKILTANIVNIVKSSSPVSKAVTSDVENVDISIETKELPKDCNQKNTAMENITTLNPDTKREKSDQVKEVKVVLTNICKERDDLISKDKNTASDKLNRLNKIEEHNNADISLENNSCKPDCHKTQSKNTDGKDIEKKENNLSETSDKQCSPHSINNVDENLKLTVKKKTSRVVKQLSIDMIEGHPFLQSPTEHSPTAKRATRKSAYTSASDGRRKRKELTETPNKSKTDDKVNKNVKEKRKQAKSLKSNSELTSDSENIKESSQDLPFSEDIIESSQDSAVTAISIASTKHMFNRKSISEKRDMNEFVENTQELIHNNNISPLVSNSNVDEKEDIELPKNKTLLEQNEMNSTENMDTEPIECIPTSEAEIEVEIVNELSTPIVINSEVAGDSQQIAEADTQPMVNDEVLNQINIENKIDKVAGSNLRDSINSTETKTLDNTVITIDSTQDGDNDNICCLENLVTPTLTLTDDNGACSPLKNDLRKKNDFLNDTIEISPIKTMSPIRDQKSPSPNNSNDFVVIKLSSPVKSNGEPFEKENSPEVFTEDKISPEKLDQSPPRVEAVNNNTSPSSSLSLKKNRPQVRAGRRAAQMLGLCAPDKLKEMNFERSNDSEEHQKSNTVSTPARRNLRMLYNTALDNNSNPDESEDREYFLKFKRSVPTPDCSPANPILKRKLAEIANEVSSPANKRKRVSFHDPPVSTTIAIEKYIEPGCLRSPQNSALKRLERQTKSNTNIKSAKRLDTVFKLDTVLTKTVESFNDDTPASGDVEMSSIEETPVVEIIKTSDLNDTDPICADLLDCNDPIDKIASELSSPGMRDLFVNELKGKVDTIGDLARMTELEVNRLCIKVPKIITAKKVLSDYASKREIVEDQVVKLLDVPQSLDIPIITDTEKLKNSSVEMSTQTCNTITKDNEMQTNASPMIVKTTQTEPLPTAHVSAQTNDSGETPTKTIVEKCISERPDFIDVLREQLSESSIALLSNKLSEFTVLEILLSKMTPSNSSRFLNKILTHISQQDTTSNHTGNMETSFLQDFSKDLILLCSRLLQKIHDKPT